MYKLRSKLESLAKELSDYDNELLVLAEQNPDVLEKVAEALVKSASAIKEALTEVDVIIEEDLSKRANLITEENVEELAALAGEFDASGDEFLQKQASVIDQILLNMGVKKTQHEVAKLAETEEIERIKARREELEKDYSVGLQQKEEMKAAEAAEAIKKTFTQYRPLETSLSTRHCPDHPGQAVARIGDNVYQCSLDKKIYNHSEGFTTLKGNKVPGSNVANQTQELGDRRLEQMSFSTREEKLQDFKG